MSEPEALAALGWDERFATLLASEAPGLAPGRVLAEERGQYLVASALGRRPGERVRPAAPRDRSSTRRSLWPAVGDWVAIEPSSRRRAPHPARPDPPERGHPRRARRPAVEHPGPRRERRRRVRRDLGQRRVQRPAPRALPLGGVGVRRDAGRAPVQVGPRRRPRGLPPPGRGGGAGCRDHRRVIGDRRGHRGRPRGISARVARSCSPARPAWASRASSTRSRASRCSIPAGSGSTTRAVATRPPAASSFASRTAS